MTKPNMKPYDPAHAGEFCYRGSGSFRRILATDSLYSDYPIITEDACGLLRRHYANGTSQVSSDFDLMCVIPKREARMITLNSFGDYKCPGPNLYEYANTTFREVMPDDISQEQARSVIDAARAIIAKYDDTPLGCVGELHAAIAALGDDT